MINAKGTKNMFLNYEKQIKQFKKSVVKVGLPEKVGGQAHSDSGLTVAQVGATHEFGVPERGIPKRSFLREPMKKKQKSISNFIKKKFSQVANNTISAGKALDEMGSMGMTISRQSFTKNDWQGVTEKTKKKKSEKGNTKDNPLIDSGQLRKSITYLVERKLRLSKINL